VPFAAALLLDPAGQSVPARSTPLTGFTRKAITACGSAHLSPGSQVASGELPWYAGVGEAGRQHLPVVLDVRKPSGLPDFV